MEKKYVSEIIGNDITKWRSGKIIIQAQTGRGKSKFILEEALPYWLVEEKKVLILVNRNSLRKQYIYQQALSQDTYETGVKIKTYQEFAGEIRKEGKLVDAFHNYNVVVLDEVHFFISDSDFNPADTYIVWQAILHSCAQCMVFMSATLEELQPFLEEYVKRIEKLESCRDGMKRFWLYSTETDYAYVKPEILPDLESLISLIAESEKKTIVFLDDIEKGRELRSKIKEIKKERRVVCLSADTMDDLSQEDKKVMKTLCMANRLECDVLITTSVLDNGISIHDPDVENIAIFTTAKSSFLQMLGRVRTESTKKVKLLLVPQEPGYWEQKERLLEDEVKEIEHLTEGEQYERGCDFLCEAVLNSNKMEELYKKIFVLVPDNEKFPIYDGVDRYLRVRKHYGDKRIVMNRLSIAKIRQSLHMVRRMHALARKDVTLPCYEQLAWIGKRPEDVVARKSTYFEREKEIFLGELAEVKDYSMEEFAVWKKELVKRFRNSYLKQLNISSGSPIKKDDLNKVLETEGLMLYVSTDNNRKNRYTIMEKTNV